jgi:multidrug efflux system outer membrane protein
MLNLGSGQIGLRHALFGATLGMALLTLSGCMVGPNYQKPSAPVAPAFTEPPPPAPAAADADAIANHNWWSIFHDPRLDDLEAQADAANRDIKIAIEHVDEAAASTRIARSYLLPTIGAAPNVSRNREAENRPNNGNTDGHSATYNDIQLPLVASYEVDAFGRVRRSIQSAHATQQATEADLRFVRLSIEASVAMDYYQLRESDEQLSIFRSVTADFTQSLALITARFQHGLNGELDVKQAEALLEQTKTQEQALEIQRAQLEHALAVLLGHTVEGFSLPDQPTTPAPPAIPVGLPADLLIRRPDIAEADRYIAAATAQIGIAKAAYYPQFSLTGAAGYESTNPVSLLNWQNTIASLGASITAPIFTAGRLRAGVEQAQSQYRQSLAQYEQTVLVAYQEVEDQLAALHFLAGESESETKAVADAQRAEEIALERYKAGLVGDLDVVYAEQTVLTDEQTEAQISGQRLVASVALIKALGGGWKGQPHP